MSDSDGTPKAGSNPVERLREFLAKAMPVIALVILIGFLILLVNTVSTAGDAPTGANEAEVYIRRTFFAVLGVGLVVSLYLGGRRPN